MVVVPDDIKLDGYSPSIPVASARVKLRSVHTTLIDTDTLAASLDKGWALVDCRYDLQNDSWGHAQYRAAHIPGAVYANLSHDLSGTPTGANGRHPLPSIEAMSEAFSSFGIDQNTQVVAYDQDAGMYASRLWWMLRYLGHHAVAVLDGGFARWIQEGRATSAGDETRPAATFTPRVQDRTMVTLDDVITLQREGTTRLVDARAPERFEGRSEPLDRVAGHIPGAANHFFKANLAADGTMLPIDELRPKLTAALGGHAPADTVMYCGSGVTACHNLLALEHAGLTGARLYPGSWSEWSADPARPVETGPASPKR